MSSFWLTFIFAAAPGIAMAIGIIIAGETMLYLSRRRSRRTRLR